MTERTIFLQALEREGEAARTAFLAEACGADTDLRQRVEQLLQSHSDAGSFLGQPVLGSSVTSDVTPGGETETHSPDTKAGEITLDFLSPSDKPNSLGRLDHYEVLDIVGRGGMGIVLRAFDEKLHRVVALKVMTRDIAGSAAARKRFSREAKAAAAVVHDHIVPIHAIEESDPTPYLVMQFIEGHSLQQKIDAEGSLELKEILRIGTQIASGLAAAHKQGLVHRDIKPSNILLENGVQRVKITDFGLARAVDDASVSQSGIVAGTPQYMSPEQADGQPVDHRSDLFSLGSVLYAMCTGRPPFRAASTVATLKRVCEDTSRPIRELNPDMPEWLADIIAKLHAKKPAERYQSAKEVAEVLERQLAGVQQTSPVVMAAAVTTSTAAPAPEASSVKAAWLLRMLLGTLAVGGIIQLVFLATWLTRGRLFGWAAGASAAAMGLLVLFFAYHLYNLRRARQTLLRPRWRRWHSAMAAVFVLVVLGPRGWLGPATIVRFATNRGLVEFVPVPGLVSVIILQNDVPVTDWLGMKSGQTLKLSPGIYTLNSGTWQAYVEGWEITTTGPLGTSSQMAPARQQSAVFTVGRGEHLILHAVIRKRPEPPPPSTYELQQTVKFQEQDFEMLKRRMLAGAVSATALVDAEIELLEARIRLAEAEKRSEDISRYLTELIQKSEEQWKYAKERLAAGAITQAEVDQIEKKVVEAKLRLSKATQPK